MLGVTKPIIPFLPISVWQVKINASKILKKKKRDEMAA